MTGLELSASVNFKIAAADDFDQLTGTGTMWQTLVPVIVGGVIGSAAGFFGPWFIQIRKDASERKKRRAEKFEELVGAVVEHYQWIAALRFFAISGQGSLPTLSPITKIEAITSTYFPEFEGSVRQFDIASNKYEMWILSAGQKRVKNEPGYESLIGHDDVLTEYTDKRAVFLMELKRFARREFQ
jgi:hypothetical protein